MYVQLLPN